LKLADAMVVEPDQADAIRQLYEPIIESQTREADEHIIIRLCDNINAMLMRDDWREHLLKSREQLPRSDGGHALPLAEILIQAQSSHVIEAISSIHQLARAGYLRSALDEAYTALQSAPTYLPLHTLIGDLLIRDGRPQDAITKFTVVANAYSVRGEAAQATNLFRRILQLAPMDLAVRTRLIEQLTARGQLDEAIAEYLELADIYYRLAELDMARKTYTTALRLAQQPSADRSWSLRILHRMADIDMQRLDWKQALRVYEQIRTIKPDDETIRRNLIDLHTRMGLPAQALAEAENYITFLDGNHRAADAVKFLEALAVEQPESLGYRRLLADQYRRAGRVQDAIDLLDVIGNVLMDAGNREGVVEVINQIISLNPSNIDEYRQLLVRLKGP
jgi:tetratricopeptide (TPR) repeat protein